MKLLGELSGEGKHRRLLSVNDRTSLQIYFAEMTKKDEYEGCFVYPVEKGHAFFARPKGEPAITLVGKYDALPVIEAMIDLVAAIVGASRGFFEGTPVTLRILRASCEDG